MPGENILDWSVTASNNGSTDTSINWLEGQARASVNNSARSMMAAHAKFRDLQNGSIITTGTANAHSFASGVGYTSVPTGLRVLLKAGYTNTGATTLNMDGIGAVEIKSERGESLRGHELILNAYSEFIYNGTNWVVLGESDTSSIGTTIFWNGSTPPTGYLIEDGSTLNAGAYTSLFAVLVKSSVVTMTIATPCVVTWPSNTFANNDPIKFTTTVSLPTGLVVGTTYYVTGLSGDTFNIAATSGGSAIATTGSQSGVHTGINAPWGCALDLSTFNLPDSRGEFIRGWDVARGIDSGRAFGSLQLDAFQGHYHSAGASGSTASGGQLWIGAGSAGQAGSGGYNVASFGDTSLALSVGVTAPTTDGSNGTPRTAAETRPRNVTKLICIKYQ